MVLIEVRVISLPSLSLFLHHPVISSNLLKIFLGIKYTPYGKKEV
jgi:hypothetical protein